MYCMKPRKLYERNNILHCCFKGSHYAPEPGADLTVFTVHDYVTVDGQAKGCEQVTVCNGAAHETWVKTDIDAAKPKRVTTIFKGPDEAPEPSPEDEEEALREEEARVRAKAAAVVRLPGAELTGNILDL